MLDFFDTKKMISTRRKKGKKIKNIDALLRLTVNAFFFGKKNVFLRMSHDFEQNLKIVSFGLKLETKFDR